MASWGMGWFGGSASRRDAPKNAILGLRSNLDMLNKRDKYIQGQVEEQDNLARKYVSTNKTAAKAALRKKKTFEAQLEQNSAQILTLEQQISSIETANINKETLNAMKNASQAMKAIHDGLTIEKVDATMEELAEQHAVAQEIAGAISNGPGVNTVDEEELDAELEELQNAETDKTLADVGTIPLNDQISRMPATSNAEPRTQEEEAEEAELQKLKAEMAM